VPPPATGGTDAAIVQGRRKAPQIPEAGGPERLDDRQHIGSERRGLLRLNPPSYRRRFRCIAPVSEPRTLRLPRRER